jgi:hypothetical protein
MMDFPGSPWLVKSSVALIDPLSGTGLRVLALQSGPDLVSSQHFQVPGDGGGDMSEVQCRKGPMVGTIHLDAELEAAKPGKFPPGARP